MIKVAFLINRKIKDFSVVSESVKNAFANDFDIKRFKSEYSGHIIELTKQALNEGYSCIIVAGGDGTVNEVINGVFQNNKTENGYDLDTISKIDIGILPVGSGNDFSRTINVDKDIVKLLSLVKTKNYKLVDVGICKFKNLNKENTERLFINITDVGLGGMVVKRVNENKISWLSSKMKYSKAIIETFLSFKKSAIEIKTDRETWKGLSLSAVFANGKFFGNGLGVAPDANISDGELELIILGNISILDYIKNVGNLKKLKPIIHKEVLYTKAKTVEVKTTDNTKFPIDIDGEYVGNCPLKIDIIPKAVNILVG